jgi:AbrB family looped-hinge helix DNA binding protein
METTRLSSKGQIVIPKSVRDARSWKPGTESAVDETSEGNLLRLLRAFPPTSFADALHLASAANARQFATLDRKLARQARRVTRVETLPL